MWSCACTLIPALSAAGPRTPQVWVPGLSTSDIHHRCRQVLVQRDHRLIAGHEPSLRRCQVLLVLVLFAVAFRAGWNETTP